MLLHKGIEPDFRKLLQESGQVAVLVAIADRHDIIRKVVRCFTGQMQEVGCLFQMQIILCKADEPGNIGVRGCLPAADKNNRSCADGVLNKLCALII